LSLWVKQDSFSSESLAISREFCELNTYDFGCSFETGLLLGEKLIVDGELREGKLFFVEDSRVQYCSEVRTEG